MLIRLFIIGFCLNNAMQGRLHSIEEPEMFDIFSLGIVDIVECEKLPLKVFFKLNVLFV